MVSHATADPAPVPDGAAGLEALARAGARSAFGRSVLPVAAFLGLRRRRHHRPPDHWIDVVHWYMDVEAPRRPRHRRNYITKTWEAPDTVNATLEFPKNFMAAYLGTYVSRIDDGGLEFRGERAR